MLAKVAELLNSSFVTMLILNYKMEERYLGT